ncbi:MAG: rRNA maturation RNase YbeY [Bacteroidota bacterium]
MVEFFSENDFNVAEDERIARWISKIVSHHGFDEGDLIYVFCNDDYLHQLNMKFLNHDTYTDIITFDYSMGKMVNGEIYISTERVLDNAQQFGVSFEEELRRVMIHGILHLCGVKDKTQEEEKEMRALEEEALNMF